MSAYLEIMKIDGQIIIAMVDSSRFGVKVFSDFPNNVPKDLVIFRRDCCETEVWM